MNPTDPVVQLYVATVVVLGMNLMVLANNTALTRAFAKEVVNPEDKRLTPEAAVVYEAGNEKTARYRRAHRNALENVPLFLLTGLLLPLLGVSVPIAATLFGVFVAVRVLHSVAYLRGWQPWRTGAFAVGALTQVALLVVAGTHAMP